ncbi:MAG TPA: NUDIX domain-containing protein [Verrucomicrobiae bacterium]
MDRSYNVSTLLYCFNDRDEALLMHRAQEPNLGLWSPPGGKVHIVEGESPHTGACREAEEEIDIKIGASEARLTGIITETGHDGNAHWLMFLFEITTKLHTVPPPHREGRFAFHSRGALDSLPLPSTDREMIWPLFWKHRGGFFAARCLTIAGQPNEWTVEQSNVKL